MKLKDKTIVIPHEFICPIQYEIMENPVMAADGHSYERSAIEVWLRDHNTSPVTNEILPHKQLVTNWNLKKSIETFVEQANRAYDREIAETEERQFRRAAGESRQSFVRERLAIETLQAREALGQARAETEVARREALLLKDSLARLQVSPGGNSEAKLLEPRLDSINKQLAGKPFCEKLLNTKAKLLKDMGRFDEALTLLNQGIEHYPENEYLITTRASVFRKMGNVDSSQRDFDRAKAIKESAAGASAAPRNVAFPRGATSFGQHSVNDIPARQARDYPRTSQASAQRESSFAAVPSRSSDHRGRAVAASDDTFETAKALAESAKILRGEKSFPEALELSKQALQLAPHNSFILNGYADSLCKMRHYQEAVDVFDEVLTLNPRDIFALGGKALAYQNLGERTQAIRAYQQVLSIQPDNKFASTSLRHLQRPVEADTRTVANSQSFFARGAVASDETSTPRSRFNFH